MYEYKIERVLRVIDGDTIDAMIDLGFDIHVEKRIRFLGINTPEKRSKLTRKIGQEATEHLEQLLTLPGELVLFSEEIGKFGRVLGKLVIRSESGEVDVNQRMIDDGHALPYFGAARSDTDFLTPEFLRGRTAA